MTAGTCSRTFISLLLLLSVLLLAGCGGTTSSSNSSENASHSELVGGAVQKKALDLDGTVSTLAGSDISSPWSASAIATDGTFVYYAEPRRIFKMALASGEVTLLAGVENGSGFHDGTGAAATFGGITGLTTDGANLYVTDLNVIRKVELSTGAVTTLAGVGDQTGSQDGTGAEARFNHPAGIVTDGSNLYVVDTLNRTIRKVVIATSAVTTLAGAPEESSAVDGTGPAARFESPFAIALAEGSLYVSDRLAIRKVDAAAGTVTTAAKLPRTASGIACAGGNLYLADSRSISKVVLATGAVLPVAGSEAIPSGLVDETGGAARFGSLYGIATDGTNLYVSDFLNRSIRRVVMTTGAVTTIVRGVASAGSIDGLADAARFHFPTDVTTDGTNLYVTDYANNTIRKAVIATGEVTTIAGSSYVANSSSDGTAAAARFDGPAAITCDGTNLYVAESAVIRKVVIATGQVTTLAGGSLGTVDGVGTAASFLQITAITTDGRNLYVADSGNKTIRKVRIATGAVTTLAKEGAVGSPAGITTDGVNLYVADAATGNVNKVAIATGAVTTMALNLGAFQGDRGITTDGTYVYVFASGTLYKIAIADNTFSIVAVQLGIPGGITTDGTSLYYVSPYENTIKVVK